MNFSVENKNLLKMYVDKQTIECDKDVNLTDINPSTCKICTNDLTKEELLSMVIRCAHFSALKHSTQKRKNAAQTPYINHPLGKNID